MIPMTDLADVLNKPCVVVMFGSPACQPCLIMEPVLKALCEELAVPFLKVDVTQDQRLANTYRVRALPTTLHLQNGHVKATVVGTESRNTLKQRLGL